MAGFSAAMLLACAIALAPNAVDPDLWGHVKYGQDALADGHLHRTATHTYTAEGYRWVNHETLAELSLALAARYLGPHGMLIAKCLLGVGLMWLMIAAARRREVSMPVVCVVLLLVATSLTSFWSMRPQLISFMLLAAIVTLLDRAFADWQSSRTADVRWLWLAPPIFALWANSHGAFLAGVCLFIAYLGCRAIEALWHDGGRAWPLVAHCVLIAGASALATLATPYGIELPLWLLDSLRHPRPEISEWLPPMPKNPFFWPFVLLALLSVVSWIFTRRRRDWTQGILIALCLWQAASHLRHIALFALLAGFWMPVHVQSLAERLRRDGPSGDDVAGSSPAGRKIKLALVLVMALLLGRLGMRLYDFPVHRSEYPVDALQYMADQNLQGRLVVSFNWAQYALAALAPDVQVAFDGRFRTCYPQEVIDMHFDFLLGEAGGRRHRSPDSGPVDGRRVLKYRDPDLVLVDRNIPHGPQVMQTQDAFVLLYQDAVAQVWGRRDRYDNPQNPNYLAAARRNISDRAPEGSVTWPAFPERRSGPQLVQDRPRPASPPTTARANQDPS